MKETQKFKQFRRWLNKLGEPFFFLSISFSSTCPFNYWHTYSDKLLSAFSFEKALPLRAQTQTMNPWRWWFSSSVSNNERINKFRKQQSHRSHVIYLTIRPYDHTYHKMPVLEKMCFFTTFRNKTFFTISFII